MTEDSREREKDDLRELLQPLAVAPRLEPDVHLTPDELAAYHAGRIDATRADQVQEHLVACRACAELLLDLAAFPALDESVEDLTDDEIAERWEATSARLGLAAPQTSGKVVPLPAASLSARRARLRSLVPYLIAASLLLVALPLLFWNLALQKENAALIAEQNEQRRALAESDNRRAGEVRRAEEAQRELAAREAELQRQSEANAEQAERRALSDRLANEIAALPRSAPRPPPAAPHPREAELIAAVTAELYPEEVMRSGTSEEVKTLVVPRGTQLVTLALNPTDAQPGGTYRLHVMNSGRTILNRNNLRLDGDGRVTIAIPTRLLPAGDYTFNLNRSESKGVSQPQAYRLRVRRG